MFSKFLLLNPHTVLFNLAKEMQRKPAGACNIELPTPISNKDLSGIILII